MINEIDDDYDDDEEKMNYSFCTYSYQCQCLFTEVLTSAMPMDEIANY